MLTIRRPQLIQRFALALLFALSLTVISPTAGASTVSFKVPRDCNSAAIIKCGVLNTSELINAYNADSYVRTAYGYYGIDNNDVKNFPQTIKAGRVDQQGNMYVNSQTAPLARDTQLITRQATSGSKALTQSGATFYVRPLKQGLTTKTADAFVVTGKDDFVYAIIASSGDLVISQPAGSTAVATPAPVKTPVTKPQAKAPAPAPTAPQTAAQQAAPTELTNTGPMNSVMILAAFTAAVTGTAGAYRYHLSKLMVRG